MSALKPSSADAIPAGVPAFYTAPENLFIMLIWFSRDFTTSEYLFPHDPAKIEATTHNNRMFFFTTYLREKLILS